MDSKVMFLNSEYDSIALEDTLNITCLKKTPTGKTPVNCSESTILVIQDYRREWMKIVAQLTSQNHSIWTIACCYHSYACWGDYYNNQSQKVPGVTGSTVAEAIDSFVFKDQRVVLVDADPWPSNKPCAF